MILLTLSFWHIWAQMDGKNRTFRRTIIVWKNFGCYFKKSGNNNVLTEADFWSLACFYQVQSSYPLSYVFAWCRVLNAVAILKAKCGEVPVSAVAQPCGVK